jgi:hypothetical protein
MKANFHILTRPAIFGTVCFLLTSLTTVALARTFYVSTNARAAPPVEFKTGSWSDKSNRHTKNSNHLKPKDFFRLSSDTKGFV